MAAQTSLISSADLDTFFQHVSAAFQRAAVLPVDRYYNIAGSRVRIRFAQDLLCRHLTAGLAHLEETSETDVSLTISVFDTASSGEPLKAPDWLFNGLLARGELRLAEDASHRIVLASASSALSLLDEKTASAIFFAQDIGKLPPWDRAAPFLSLLHLFLRRQRVQVVHAAAVGSANGDALLLVGPGGAGKSTTAISCLLSGMRYLGDDYTAITLDAPYRVHSLYCSGKLTALSLSLLAMTKGNPVSEEEDKALLFFQARYSHLLTASARLKAIVVPSIDSANAPSYHSLHPADALCSFAPSCIKQLPYAGAELFSQLSLIVRSIPCFKASLGANPKANAEMLQEILV